MEYFFGVDIGTTSVKSVAFSREGKSLCESSISYPIQHPLPDWSEQDPEEIFRALCKTVENILQELKPHLPALVSFCSAMHSIIAVDKTGMAISPSIIWADNRAASISTEIHKAKRAKDLYEHTGLPVHAMSPFCKLLWLKENQKELFDKAYKFVGIKEYAFFKLFGKYVIDVSVASATGLLNAGNLQWDPWILKQVEITADKLSEVVPVHQIFYPAGVFPALQKIPFVIGGSDGAMANIGSTEEPGSLVITVGTSSAARVIINRPFIDPQMRTFCYYINQNQWLLGGASNNGGIVLQWLQENLFHSEKTVIDFLKQASAVKPGADGLIFLPYLLGERAPIWNADAKGVLFGVQINHSQASMIRASLEGIIYCIYGISQALMEQSQIRAIYATGGFARNELGLQIMSDVFNLPVMVSETVENSAWGAVKCGMMAIGVKASDFNVINKKYFPNADAHTVYSKNFLKFQRLYELLKEEFL
jgi:gluconokinase